MPGYSGTPLLQKLGIKPGSVVIVVHPPADYSALLGPLPEGAQIRNRIVGACEFVHLFTTDQSELKRYLIRLRSSLKETGVVWISWPKKSSGVVTTVNENVIRDLALPLGFVDTKVCAVDETWSALKLMVRRENRNAAKK